MDKDKEEGPHCLRISNHLCALNYEFMVYIQKIWVMIHWKVKELWSLVPVDNNGIRYIAQMVGALQGTVVTLQYGPKNKDEKGKEKEKIQPQVGLFIFLCEPYSKF